MFVFMILSLVMIILFVSDDRETKTRHLYPLFNLTDSESIHSPICLTAEYIQAAVRFASYMLTLVKTFTSTAVVDGRR